MVFSSILHDLLVQDGRLALNIASGRGSVGVAKALADRMQQLRVRTDSLHDIVDDLEGDLPVGEQEKREGGRTIHFRSIGQNSTITSQRGPELLTSRKTLSEMRPESHSGCRGVKRRRTILKSRHRFQTPTDVPSQ